MLKLSDFDYRLPKELIAQYPLRERDAARLLVLHRKKGTVEHRVFKDILDYLDQEDLMILNNTKVLPARLRGFRSTGGRVEVLLLTADRPGTFRAFIKPGRVKIGEKISFDSGKISAVIQARGEIVFDTQNIQDIYRLGVMPLPPYIKRETEDMDQVYYQTVYAKEEGAIASPTAGLHFTEELIQKIQSRGTEIAYVTLHVGAATFRPVKTDDITAHKMEPEVFKIPESTAALIERARVHKKRVFAVGTTSLRALETYAHGVKEGCTDLFIYPGYKFSVAKGLLTNFHLPRTTLYMLVCAFAGEKPTQKAYREAIDKKYRFYSYGDAMLIL